MNNLTTKIWFRAVAFTLSLSVPATELYAYIPSEPIPIQPPSIQIALDQISVPEALGTIQERHKGKGDKLVVFIQDAHGILSAQENIGKLVKHFHETYGINLLTVEGAAGEQPMRKVRNLPNQKIREEVARDFLQDLELTGDEYYIIAENPDLTMYGAERMLRYYINRHEFFQAKARSEKLKPVLERFLLTIHNLEKELYNKDLKRFIREKRRFEANPSLVDPYIKFLTASLRGREASRGSEGAVAIADLSSLFLSTSPPNTIAFLKVLKQLEEDIQNALIRTDQEHRLFRLARLADLFDQLLTLSLTPDAHEELKNHIDQLSEDHFKTELRSLRGRRSRPKQSRSTWPSEFSELFKPLKLFLSFYKHAEERDKDLAGKTIQIMVKKNTATALSIAGGFHTPGVTQLWRKNGISYVLIQPQIDRKRALPK